MELGDV